MEGLGPFKILDFRIVLGVALRLGVRSSALRCWVWEMVYGFWSLILGEGWSSRVLAVWVYISATAQSPRRSSFQGLRGWGVWWGGVGLEGLQVVWNMSGFRVEVGFMFVGLRVNTRNEFKGPWSFVCCKTLPAVGQEPTS